MVGRYLTIIATLIHCKYVTIIWVIGGPGSGKGTQSSKIAQKYGFMHIDPVALVGEEVDSLVIFKGMSLKLTNLCFTQIVGQTATGKKFEKSLTDGNSVPLSEIILEMNSNRDGLKGFVTDGYPVDMEEAKVLENVFGSPSMIIALELEEQMESRSSSTSYGPAARPCLTSYIDTSKDVMDNYAEITLKIDANQAPESVFKEIQMSMDTWVNRNRQIVLAR
ncbi:adenylate kinase isoenzyme 1-like isoform X1 [Drosophila elegans]|uniref:adenylate kinase isoenzyme 1-like isoform X1 n=1 Tax=Drosophila elegans TaxID=30023 RepID=UPI0007E61C82|nr:adenylate kinase isoenzyme 1-like isoform X1 [Drosophila elegans]